MKDIAAVYEMLIGKVIIETAWEQPAMTDGFFATTTDRRGRMRQRVHAATREAAARLVFQADPQAKTCSTSRAHRQSDGNLWNTGSGMIWHRRMDTTNAHNDLDTCDYADTPDGFDLGIKG